MAKETNKTKKDKKDKKGFLKEFKAELKRVSWPTFKQLVNNTTAVLTIVLIIAVIVFVLDVIYENLNNYGVEKLKTLVTSSSEESQEETLDNQTEVEIDSDQDEEVINTEENANNLETDESTDTSVENTIE